MPYDRSAASARRSSSGMMRRKRVVLMKRSIRGATGHVICTGILVSLAVTACSSSGSSAGSSARSTASAAGTSAVGTAGAQPLKAGTLKIGTSADFPPMMIRDPSDPSKVQGFEADMIKALMDHVHQNYTIQISNFSGLIPAIQSGQLDMAVSDVYVTAEREKVVDFVPYMKSGLSVLVAQKNLSTTKSELDLCGKPIGVVTGSPSEAEAGNSMTQKCKSAGKAGLDLKSFQAVSDELAQIDNGRLFGIIEDSLSLIYVQKQKPGAYGVAFVVPGTEIEVGIAVAKNSPMLPALRSDVEWYLSSAQYKTDASKWGIPDTSLLSPSSSS